MKERVKDKLEKRSTELIVLTVIIVAGGAFAAASGGSDILDAGTSTGDGLIAEYRFDTGADSTAYDTSGNNDATLVNFEYNVDSGWTGATSERILGQHPDFSGWSRSPTYDCAGTKMMGGYDNFGSGDSTTKALNLPEGEYRVSFNYYFGDSWDGESGKLYWNGDQVWSVSAQGDKFGSQNLCGAGWSDGVESPEFTTIVDHSGGQADITFNSTLNQAPNDEWFGVNNIELRKIGGKSSRSLKFDGNDDYVNTPAGVFSSNSNWTASLWFRSDDISKHTHFTGVPGQHSNGWTPLSHFGIRNSELAWWDTNGWRQGATKLSSDRWYHTVIVGRPGEVEMYLNGRSENLETSNLQNNIGRVENIGRRQHNNDRHFDGRIDNFKIYSESLSDSEIKSLYNQGSITVGSSVKPLSSEITRLSFQKENSSHVFDTSGQYNHGRKQGGVTQKTAVNCKKGRCMEFDGTSSTGIDLNDVWSDHTNSRTFMLWFKEAESGASNNDRILSQDCSEWFCVLDEGTDSIEFGFDGFSSHPSISLDESEWHHLTLVFNESASEAVVYLDGMEVYRNGYNSGWSHLTRPVVLGGNTEGTDDISGGHWEGKIDEFKVFSKPLTQEEIIEEAKDLEGGGTVLDLRFNKDGGGRVTDYSSEKNHGTLQPNASSGPGWVGGLSGNALRFDGSEKQDYVEVTGSSAYETKSASVSLWISEQSGSRSRLVYHTGSDSALVMGYGDLSVEFRGCGGGYDGSSTNLPADGEFRHVGATWNYAKDRYKIFVNGELVKTGSMGGGCFANTTGGLRMGRTHWGGDDSWFDGRMDNVRVYPFAVSEEKMESIYSREKSLLRNERYSKSIDDGLVLSQTFDRIETCGQSDTISCPSGMSGEVAVDESGEANHGELVNGPTEKNAERCKSGGCLKFSKDSAQVDVSNNDGDLNLAGDVTISSWVKIPAPEARWTEIVSQEGSNTGFKYYTHSAGGVRIYSGAGTESGDCNHGGPRPQPGEWIQVTAVFDSSSGSWSLYKNGEFYRSDADGSCDTNFAVDKPLKFSKSDFNGSIDQVRVYNRSLSDHEIWNLYTRGRDRESGMAGPVAHYPMQVESSPLRDVSGEGNHGELDLLGESGTFNTSDGEWKTIRFERSYKDPVVVGTPNTHNGEAAIYFEVRNVQSHKAEMRLCESEGGNNDGCDTHGTERAGYVVVDAAATDDIPGIEAGSFENYDAGGASFSSSFSTTPMVFSQPQTDRSDGEVVSWTTSRDTSSFNVKVCDQDSTNGCSNPDEEIGWIAVEPGNEPFEQPGEADNLSNEISSSNWGSASFSSSFSEQPVGVFSVQNNDGGQDPKVDEIRNVDTSGMQMRFCELETGDTCDGHVDMEYAYLAVSEGLLTYSNGNFPRYVDTKRGKALDFDGTDDYISVPDSSGVSFSDESFSLSGWVKTSSTGEKVIFGKYANSNWNGYWFGQGSSNGFRTCLASGGSQTCKEKGDFPNDGNWHHVTFVYQHGSGEWEWYQDGELLQTASGQVSFTDNSDTLRLGDGRWQTGNEWNGRLDDLRVYPYALDQEQVKKVMNSGAVSVTG